ncbi:hypothetical protein LOC68_03160 [Blastopirellula sp. JC732]|uniref:Uncharacterized protein n=1 Tax=Blastopirellula sediminis TaxID=2894196 RepID=A0A9X1MI84_9BACT|nr:hypothetical protein [Blastopirellula sediminis]MCC9607823.1 hypothetical protein [Blastopirellula sediminis]MCC9627384.1 hypothetical protein [Blastopirellula sediminis]
MKASWRHLGIVFVATQAVGCFGVRYHDSMALPTCDTTCQTAAHGHHHDAEAHGEENQLIAYDQPMIPPRPKFHPVPTRPAFAPRVEYSPPQLIRVPVLAEVPPGPILLQPTPPLKPIPVESVPAETLPHTEPIEQTAPLPLPRPTIPAKPIIAPLPQPLLLDVELDQPEEFRTIQGTWRTKPST